MKQVFGWIAFCALISALIWPAERVDVSPLFQRRPERPPHPIHIYYPPGK